MPARCVSSSASSATVPTPSTLPIRTGPSAWSSTTTAGLPNQSLSGVMTDPYAGDVVVIDAVDAAVTPAV